MIKLKVCGWDYTYPTTSNLTIAFEIPLNVVENALKSFDTEEEKQQGHQYKEGELVYPKGYAPYVYHSNEYIRKNMEHWDSNKNAFVGPEGEEQKP